MAAQAKSQVLQAGLAFRNRDVELAEDLVRQDDEIDRLNRQCFQLALDSGDDADMREWAMTMMLMARALERIGDNAVDIGEQVAFVVTGLFREFTDASHPDPAPPTSGTKPWPSSDAAARTAASSMTCSKRRERTSLVPASSWNGC